MNYNEKKSMLRRRLRELDGAVVAFSGGVDSSVLLALAHQEMKRVFAVTAVSPSLPSQDHIAAREFCKKRGIEHILCETPEILDPQYIANTEDRCYYCKRNLYNCLEKIAQEKGCKNVLEGTNASDLEGHRPGFRASTENLCVSTLFVDCGLTKDDIRSLARELKLEISERPSSACLASRIPFGVEITPEILRRIDLSENLIRECGIKQVRVRHHGELARIEVGIEDLAQCVELRKKITMHLNKFGYKFVTLDLQGYRTGGTVS